jgi:excinuclease ABC subunit C
MSEERFDARLDTVPMSPGVYLMKDASGSVIYVGKAKKLRNR